MIEILEKALAVYEIQQQKDLVKKAIKENTVPNSRDMFSPSAVKKRQTMDEEIEEPNTSSKKRKVSE